MIEVNAPLPRELLGRILSLPHDLAPSGGFRINDRRRPERRRHDRILVLASSMFAPDLAEDDPVNAIEDLPVLR